MQVGVKKSARKKNGGEKARRKKRKGEQGDLAVGDTVAVGSKKEWSKGVGHEKKMGESASR